jgi:hypothetical protein
MATMQPNANTLAFSPVRPSSPRRCHHAGHFMPWNSWIKDSWPAPFDDDRIAVTYATCLNFDAHLSWAWLGDRQLNDRETGSSRANLGGFHGWCCDCGCHKSSYFFFCLFDLVGLVKTRRFSLLLYLWTTTVYSRDLRLLP